MNQQLLKLPVLSMIKMLFQGKKDGSEKGSKLIFAMMSTWRIRLIQNKTKQHERIRLVKLEPSDMGQDWKVKKKKKSMKPFQK